MIHSRVLCGNDAITVLCHPGDDSLTLVKAQRHRWQETCPTDRPFWFVIIDVLLWAVKNVLGSRNQVCHIIMPHNSPCPDEESSRCLNGALNGNIGILKSLVSEITDSTNLPQAYGYMPIAWVRLHSLYDVKLF